MWMDEGTSRRFAELIRAHESALIERWLDTVARSTRGRIAQAELSGELGEMYEALAEGLSRGGGDLGDDAFKQLRERLEALSASRAVQGFTPSETATSVFALKETILGLLGDDGGVGMSDLTAFLRFVDELGLLTFETYTRARERLIAAQADQLLELATPVVKLWDGVLAVPLVGTLDSARAQVVMESLLQAVVDTGSARAIIDITGVAAVDTQVAQHLLKTVMAARLMGAQCIISGIRPQIAQTIVALGIDFGEIATKASLADALVLALRDSGFDVVRRSESPDG